MPRTTAPIKNLAQGAPERSSAGSARRRVNRRTSALEPVVLGLDPDPIQG